MITRRDFMQYAGAGLLLAGTPSIAACGGTGRDDLSPPGQTTEPVRGLDEEEMRILYLASLAPSGHNAQPWTVKVAGPKHWIVGSDKSSWLPAVDPNNRELLLSIGAFLENLVFAARALGYETEIKVIAARPDDPDIADVRLRKGKAVDVSVDRIRARRVVRNGYSADEIRKEDLSYITRHDESSFLPAKVPSPHAFYFSNGSATGKLLQEGLIEANRRQAFREPAQVELAHWIRWSDKDARRFRNGLTPASMEIGGVAGWYVRNFYDAGSVLKKGFREQTVDMVSKQVRTCGGWLVLTSVDSEVQTLVSYGMAFEGMFLKVRERMIGLHPMMQMIEEEPLKNEVARALGVEGQVQWIVRMGYVRSYPEPVSLRRPVSWFVRS